MSLDALLELVLPEIGNSMRASKYDYYICTSADCAHSGRTTKHTVSLDNGFKTYTCLVCGCIKRKKISGKAEKIDPSLPT